MEESLLEATRAEFEMASQKKDSGTDPMSQDETFARISTAIPLDYMKGCTIVGVGCGGARGFYEDMARCGVGKFLLIDGTLPAARISPLRMDISVKLASQRPVW